MGVELLGRVGADRGQLREAGVVAVRPALFASRGLRDVEGDAEEERLLLAGRDIDNPLCDDAEALLRRVLCVGRGHPEAPKEAPERRVVLGDDRPERSASRAPCATTSTASGSEDASSLARRSAARSGATWLMAFRASASSDFRRLDEDPQTEPADGSDRLDLEVGTPHSEREPLADQRKQGAGLCLHEQVPGHPSEAQERRRGEPESRDIGRLGPVGDLDAEPTNLEPRAGLEGEGVVRPWLRRHPAKGAYVEAAGNPLDHTRVPPSLGPPRRGSRRESKARTAGGSRPEARGRPRRRC